MTAPTFRYESIKDTTFKDSLLVVAFPAAGYVSQVAARYLIASQELPLVGAFRSDVLPPAVTVEAGVPRPTMRVHLGAQVCGLDRSCSQLAILISDIVLPDNQEATFAHEILQWAKENGVGSVLVLEGMPHSDPDADTPHLVGASSSQGCLELLQKQGIDLLDGVVVSGIPGAFLDESAKSTGPCVVSLFVEAHNQFRDAAAAATLVESIDKFLLHIPIDAAPLRKMAEELTQQIRQAQRPRSNLPSMYA